MSTQRSSVVTKFTLPFSLLLLLGCGAGDPDVETEEATDIAASQSELTFEKIRDPLTCPGCFMLIPTNLKITRSVDECVSHSVPDLFGFTTLLCASSLAGGNLVLSWDYSRKTAIDRYRIYEVTPSGLVERAQQSRDTTMYLLKTPPPSTCYTVAAEKGGTQAFAHEPVCTPAVIGPSTMRRRIFPSVRRRFMAFENKRISGGSSLRDRLADEDWNARFGATVGFSVRFNWLPWPAPNSTFWGFTRAGLLFDVSEMRGLPVLNARLSMNAMSSVPAASVACATELLTANAPWKDAPVDAIPQGTLLTDIPREAKISIDVLSTVADWAHGTAPNNGFVVKSFWEGAAEHDEDCFTRYADIALDVRYIPPLD